MAKKPAKPKIREAAALTNEITPETPDGGEERLTDLRHQDELNCMKDRLYGLEAAILGVCDRDEPFDHGLMRLACDVTDAMKNCAAAFEAERHLRMAERHRR